MSGARAFLRLAGRPGVLIGDLLVVAGIGGLLAAGSAFLAALAAGAPAGPEGGDLALPRDQLGALPLVLVPAAAGTVAAYMVRGLLLAHASWTLPGVRRAFRGPLLATGALAVLAAVLLSMALGVEAGAPAALALGWLSFLLGTSLFDFALPRAPRLLLAAALLLSVLFAVRLAALAGAHPWLFAAIAVAATPAAMSLLFGATTHRTRILVPTNELGLDHYPARGPRASGAPLVGRLPEALWPLERTRTIADFLRAAAYEWSGRLSLGWLWIPLAYAAGGAALIFIVGFTDGLEVELSARSGLEYVHYALFLPREKPAGTDNAPPWFLVVVVLSAVFSGLALTGGPALRSGVVFPLSRDDRARVAYLGGALLTAAGAALSIALVGALAAAVLHFGGFARPAEPVPWWLRVCLFATALFPLAQWARAALVERFTRRSRAAAYGFAAGAGVLAFALLIDGLEEAWRSADAPLSLRLAALLALALALQAAWRAWLARHFARCDLS